MNRDQSSFLKHPGRGKGERTVGTVVQSHKVPKCRRRAGAAATEPRRLLGGSAGAEYAGADGWLVVGGEAGVSCELGGGG